MTDNDAREPATTPIKAMRPTRAAIGEVSRRDFVGNSIKGAAALTVATSLAGEAVDTAPPVPDDGNVGEAATGAARVLDRSFATDQVPGDCEYRVALPPDYRPDRDVPYPLLLLLHGGGGSRDFLDTVLPTLDELWREGRLEACVTVCPSAARSFYMDYRDGAEAWETVLVGALLDAVRAEFHVAAERERLAVSGVSMDGMGSLRFAFKHPHLFGTVAALEPAIEASLAYDALTPADTFYRADQYMGKYGVDGAVDAADWALNNPSSIAANAPERLRTQAILIEAGSEDGLELHHGTEFLHRVLWDNDVKHEYRHVLGADHVGSSLDERIRYALAFIGRQWNPLPDEAAAAFREAIAPLRRQAGLD